MQPKPFVACIRQPTANKEVESSDAIKDEIQSVKITNLHTLTTAPTTANTIIPSNDSVITIDQLTSAAHSDKKYQSLLSTIHEGFPPAKHNTHPSIREFWEVRHRLTTSDGLALMGDRLVIPLHYQRQILRALHSAHQGVTSMQARANQTVYWPGMNASIRNFKAGCTTCSNIAPSQSKETINLSPPPQWPFQQICIDYFEISGHTYLSCVDRFSGWLSLYSYETWPSNKLILDLIMPLHLHCLWCPRGTQLRWRSTAYIYDLPTIFDGLGSTPSTVICWIRPIKWQSRTRSEGRQKNSV